ncbi:MAG: OsmC family protein [Acetobacteraceae bacterium]
MCSQTVAPVKPPMNGVDTPALLATISAVGAQPELAKFQFRAENTWINGTHSVSTIAGFSGAGGEQKHGNVFTADSDHPAVLCGADMGPTPVEWILHGLAGCLTAGIGNIAAARGVRLTEVSSSITGDIDLRGILGLSKDVRNGFQNVQVAFSIKGDAPPEKLAEIVRQSQARSAVFDVLTNGIPVSITVNQ